MRCIFAYMQLLFFIIITLSTFINAQSFGQNKVQYRDFDWQFIQSQHFDIYYYDGLMSNNYLDSV